MSNAMYSQGCTMYHAPGGYSLLESVVITDSHCLLTLPAPSISLDEEHVTRSEANTHPASSSGYPATE